MSLILDGTNGLSDVDGSAATPAIRGTDTNTGIFFPAADTIAFAEGGAEIARFDSSGHLIVGGTTALNTSSGRGNITINGSSNAILNFSAGGVDQGYIYHDGTNMLIDNSKNGFQRFATNGTERMRILNDGSILLGTTTQGGATGISFSNASDSAAYGKSMYMNSPYNGTRNAISFAYNSAGGVGQIVTGTNSVSYQSGSDYRLKENIAPMTGALATVSQLNPVTFTWKLDGSHGQGFIAHEIQAVVPDCATGEKDAVDADGKPVYQGVDTSFLVATLTAAIQELKSIVDAQAARITALEGAAV
jgi:hypothetical protein